MTLFARATDDNADFLTVLDKYYRGEPDPRTTELLWSTGLRTSQPCGATTASATTSSGGAAVPAMTRACRPVSSFDRQRHRRVIDVEGHQ